MGDQEARVIAAFQKHYGIEFQRPDLLKLALTHRSYLSVSGQGPRESNERLEFLGDSVLGLVTSEFLYRENPAEHEGQLTKTKSLLVSKAILSRRALAMGLGRFVLMSHSEVESGGRQRLSIVADAFEAVVGAIYLDQGFDPARRFIARWLLREADEITADKRHTNYKSHLQEYVQSNFHTHPVYRIRGEIGPDHSKHFHVEVLVGKRFLGEGRGRNKKEAEQSAARNALERIEGGRGRRGERKRRTEFDDEPAAMAEAESTSDRKRSRRGRRARGARDGEPAVRRVAEPRETEAPAPSIVPLEPAKRQTRPREAREPQPEPRAPILDFPAGESPVPDQPEVLPPPRASDEDDLEEIGRPEGPLEERHIDPYGFTPEARPSLPDASRDARRPAAASPHDDDEGQRESLKPGEPRTRERGGEVDRGEPQSAPGRSFGRRRSRGRRR